MDCSLFDQIYVINLARSVDRREHIIREFARVGIPVEKYCFFPAVDGDSSQVQEILKNGGKQRLPSGTIRVWKHLNKYQIGNWSSYLGIWEDIIKNAYEFCLVCEDDIKFADYYLPVVSQVFDYEYLLHQGIDPGRPVVIGVGSGWQQHVHKPNKIIGLTQVKPTGDRDCNPCYIINYSMAVELLKNSLVVDQASDPYTHNVIGARHQRYWVVPQPVYELSWNPKMKMFPSTIEGPLKAGDRLK